MVGFLLDGSRGVQLAIPYGNNGLNLPCRMFAEVPEAGVRDTGTNRSVPAMKYVPPTTT